MNSTQETINGPAGQRHLLNTGGPRSRVRSEKITSNIFDTEELKTHSEIHSLHIPENTTDIEKWVISLYEPGVLFDWEHVKEKLKLPAVRMLVVPTDIKVESSTCRYEMFRSAVILSKCSRNYYTPDSPMIFTRNRLNRNVELVTINLSTYYEMD